jgi:quercetin dioxygenase-like cupin family protein
VICDSLILGQVVSSYGVNVMYEVILKRFERPDEVREFEKGRFELVHIGGMTIGRATYQPGWKWSAHVGPLVETSSCEIPHVGLVLAGRATAAMDDGRVVEMKAGDLFYIAPGHDSWVVGDEPYVSIHVLGAGDYAHGKPKHETAWVHPKGRRIFSQSRKAAKKT